MKLYVDDVRPAPQGWTLATTIAAAQEILASGAVEEVSLDHDLGACAACHASGADIGDMQTDDTTFMFWCPHAEDGLTLVLWMKANQCVPSVVTIHSRNPRGRQRMLAALAS